MPERLFLSSGNLTVLETSSTSDSDSRNIVKKTLLVSVLDHENLNEVLIGAKEGKKYFKTLINKPVQAYLIYDEDGKPEDFGGHELRVKLDEDGEPLYYFATQSIGTHTNVWIENRYIKEYGKKVDCILAEVELWVSRYPEYYAVAEKLIDEGKLSSSWEIDTMRYEYANGKKKLLEFEFIGNALLGSNVSPAVRGAGVITSEADLTLRHALEKDILVAQTSAKIEKEDCSLEDEKKIVEDNVEVVEPVVSEEETPVEEVEEAEVVADESQEETEVDKAEVTENETPDETPEVASLTINDIVQRVYASLRDSKDKLDELGVEYAWELNAFMYYPAENRIIFTFYSTEKQSVMIEVRFAVAEDDTLTISEIKKVEMVFVDVAEVTKIDETKNKVIELSEKLVELNTELSSKEEKLVELSEYKEKLDEMEKAEKDAKKLADMSELKNKYLATRMISEDEFESNEEISLALSELDEQKLKLIIADRIVEGRKPAKPDTSEKEKLVDEKNGSEERVDISSYIGYKSKPTGSSVSKFIYND